MTQGPFEDLADEYDQWFERHRWAYASELSALRAARPEGFGLEIGVGTGRFAHPLSIPVGLDPSLPMLRKAGERGVAVVRGVAESLPFRDGAFDLALLVTVLCFVSDPLSALREARRVVRPSGHLLLGILDRDSPLGRRYEAGAASSRFYRGARFLSASEACHLLERAGCEVLETHQTLLSDPSGLASAEPVLEGNGQGLFVVISART